MQLETGCMYVLQSHGAAFAGSSKASRPEDDAHLSVVYMAYLSLQGHLPWDASEVSVSTWHCTFFGCSSCLQCTTLLMLEHSCCLQDLPLCSVPSSVSCALHPPEAAHRPLSNYLGAAMTCLFATRVPLNLQDGVLFSLKGSLRLCWPATIALT